MCKRYTCDILFHPFWGLVRLTLSVEASFPPQEHTSDGSGWTKSNIRDAMPGKYPNETEHAVCHPECCEYDGAKAEDQLDKLEHAAYQGGRCGIKTVHDRHEHYSQHGAVGKNWPDIDHVEECGQ